MVRLRPTTGITRFQGVQEVGSRTTTPIRQLLGIGVLRGSPIVLVNRVHLPKHRVQVHLQSRRTMSQFRQAPLRATVEVRSTTSLRHILCFMLLIPEVLAFTDGLVLILPHSARSGTDQAKVRQSSCGVRCKMVTSLGQVPWQVTTGITPRGMASEHGSPTTTRTPQWTETHFSPASRFVRLKTVVPQRRMVQAPKLQSTLATQQPATSSRL